MSGILFYITAATCLAVLAVLIFGVATYARGGEFNRKYANKIMRLRIAVQAVAVVLILLTVYFARQGN